MTWYEAKRWCGQITIYIAYMDNLNSWKVSINTPDRQRFVEYINSDNWITNERKSVDCSEAYDEAARAAMSFVLNDHSGDVESYVSMDDKCKLHIGRSHHTAYWQWAMKFTGQ